MALQAISLAPFHLSLRADNSLGHILIVLSLNHSPNCSKQGYSFAALQGILQEQSMYLSPIPNLLLTYTFP